MFPSLSSMSFGYGLHILSWLALCLAVPSPDSRYAPCNNRAEPRLARLAQLHSYSALRA